MVKNEKTTKKKNVVANLTAGIIDFYFAQTITKAKSLNSKQFSKNKTKTKSDMQAVNGYNIFGGKK